MQFTLGDHVKTGAGTGGGQKQRQVQVKHLEPALIETHNHRRQQDEGKKNHQGIADGTREVDGSFNLDLQWLPASPDRRQQFPANLDQPLGPARLLSFEGVHLHWQLGRAGDRRIVDEFPAVQLGAIAEVRVFGQGIVLPAARILDGGAAPHAPSSVEIEKAPREITPAVLDYKVAVQQDSFYLRQVRVVLVDPRPPAL